jgi:hypothetical protein
MKADDPGGTAVDDPGDTTAVGANGGDASPAAVVAVVSSLSAPTTSSSRVHPLNANANGMSKSMSTEMTVMSKLEALDFGAVVGLLGAACGAGRALFLL